MTLIAGRLLSTAVRAFQIIDMSWSLPYKWSPTTQSFVLLSKPRVIFNKFRLLVAYVNFFLIIAQILWTWRYNNILVKTYCVMCMAVYVMMLSGSHLNCLKPEFLIALLNSMVTYEKKRFGSGENVGATRKSNWFLKFLIIYNAVSVILPIPYFFNTLLNPCLPSYVGSFLLLEQCDATALGITPDDMYVQLGRKIFIASIAFFNWQYLMPGMAVHLCLMFVQGLCFPEYIRNYGRQLSKLGKGPIVTSDLPETTSAFREVQMMIVNHRHLNGSFVITPYMASGLASEITSLYNCIALQMPTQMFIFSMWTAVVNASTFIFAYGCLANVFQASVETKGQILWNKQLMKNKWFRRYFRSCPVLRVTFGSGNFLEPVTPLVTQEFVMNNTVSLLLMG